MFENKSFTPGVSKIDSLNIKVAYDIKGIPAQTQKEKSK